MTASGKAEGIPYSLSRWTDVPAGKWAWFRERLRQGHMMAFDPRTAIPRRWSLLPEDILSLIFWTRNPTALVQDAGVLRDYPVHVHHTVTGWEEVEHGAPGLKEGVHLLNAAVQVFGPDRVTWRFSPVPLVADILPRFRNLVEQVPSGITAYVSFLQTNDRVPETRPLDVRVRIANELERMAVTRGVALKVCMEDAVAVQAPHLGGVCARTEGALYHEQCGCSMAADPFTLNEACVYGCTFCYAADLSLSAKKRNTTVVSKVKLPVVI